MLVEAGLDVNTADMWYEQIAEGLGDPFRWKPFVGKNPSFQYNLFSYRKGYVKPCWSHGALIKAFENTAPENRQMELSELLKTLKNIDLLIKEIIFHLNFNV